eukprot:11537931-Prorocentrum_lima.AAC.1
MDQLNSSPPSTLAVNYMKAYGLRQVAVHYGCPKHWKGAWDRVLGWLSGLLKETAKSRTLTTIEE